jgi:hypothetical protein
MILSIAQKICFVAEKKIVCEQDWPTSQTSPLAKY